jgi:hypothetical protein
MDWISTLPFITGQLDGKIPFDTHFHTGGRFPRVDGRNGPHWALPTLAEVIRLEPCKLQKGCLKGP